MKPGDLTVVTEPVEKYNPHHDSNGRFASGGAGGGAGAGAMLPPSANPRKGMGDIVLDESTVAEMQGGSAGEHIVKDKNGNYMFTPERQALHDKLVAESVDGIPSSENPTYVIMGGGPAAGKSSILDSGLVSVPKDTVEVNADVFKEKLPEWGNGGPGVSSMVHAESSYLAKRTQAAAFERKQNVVLDGTGDTSVTSMNKKIDTAKANGYRVEANYVSLPTEMAIPIAEARALRSGRDVPVTFIRSQHAGVSQTFPAIAHKFDSVKLYDTTIKGKPRLVVSGGGGKVDIIDQKLYNVFLAKGNE
jgi:predicted ABC-type ATPase